MSEKTTPADIAVDLQKREIRITWQDEHLSVYSLDMLRQKCPCAVCNELRRSQNTDPLRVLTSDQAAAGGDLVLDKPIQIVGQYALQFFWADGHKTGLYTYNYLRELG